MKRIIARLLALTLILAMLPGCASTLLAKAPQGTVEPGPSAAVPTGTVETKTPAEPEDQQDTPEEQEGSPVSLGRIEGGVYTNTYAGFGCELDSNWEFYTAEELQELPGNVKDLLADSELGDTVAEMTQISDMKAENMEDLTTINVLYTKLDAQSRLSYLLLSEEDLVDVMLEQGEMLKSSYAQVGMEVETLEKVTVDFLGEEHFAMRTSGSQSGIPCYMLQLIDYSRGRYGVTTTLCSYMEDKTEELAALFYKVD